MYDIQDDVLAKPVNTLPVTVEHIAAAGIAAIAFYITGIVAHKLISLPAPVAMLFLVVLAKLIYTISPKLENGARTIYSFFAKAVTYPLLFAIGITTTSWADLMAAFNLANIVTIVVTVLTLTKVVFLWGNGLVYVQLKALLLTLGTVLWAVLVILRF